MTYKELQQKVVQLRDHITIYHSNDHGTQIAIEEKSLLFYPITNTDQWPHYIEVHTEYRQTDEYFTDGLVDTYQMILCQVPTIAIYNRIIDLLQTLQEQLSLESIRDCALLEI